MRSSRTLGEICKIFSSKRIFASEYVPSGVPFFRGKEIIEKHNGKEVSSELYISREKYEKIKNRFGVPRKGDILLTSVGTLGVSWLVDESEFYFKDGNLTCLRNNPEYITPEYLYFWLNSSFAQNQIVSQCIGSTQKALTIETLKKFVIELPSLDAQKRVCSILSSLENKIKLNDSINKNLEEQAQVLYKSWFIDYDPFNGIRPSNWDIGTIEDLSKEIVCGKTPSTKIEEYYGSDIPFITIPDMHGNTYAVTTERYLSNYGASSQSKKTLPQNSICVSCIGTAGLVTLVASESQTNQQINSIIPKDGYSPFYIYLLMQTLSEVITKLGQSGSTIVNLNKAQFGKIKVTIPSITDMTKFHEITSPLFALILKNQKENIYLSSTRDKLLPKLMSGELDISNVKI